MGRVKAAKTFWDYLGTVRCGTHLAPVGIPADMPVRGAHNA